MAIQVKYEVYVDFEGVDLKKLEDRLKPEINAHGLELITVRGADGYPDVATVECTTEETADKISIMLEEAVIELGGNILTP